MPELISTSPSPAGAGDTAASVLIVNAHLTYPNWSEGGLNRTLTEAAEAHLRERGHRVHVTCVEEPYDADAEVQRHLDADLVMLQTPINWFGAPWIHKRYVDDVFNAGLHSKKLVESDGRSRTDPTRQYGTGGRMQGRGFFVSATWNAPATIFDDRDGYLLGGKGVDDVLLSISSAYRFAGYDILEHYGVYDIFKDGDVDAGIRGIGAHLDAQLASLRTVVAA